MPAKRLPQICRCLLSDEKDHRLTGDPRYRALSVALRAQDCARFKLPPTFRCWHRHGDAGDCSRKAVDGTARAGVRSGTQRRRDSVEL